MYVCPKMVLQLIRHIFPFHYTQFESLAGVKTQYLIIIQNTGLQTVFWIIKYRYLQPYMLNTVATFVTSSAVFLGDD